jgi:hypothetical protein
MATLTSANVILMFSVPLVFPTPQQIQGFATDDVFDTDALEVAQTQMGVDGLLSGGFVFNEIKQSYTLQADSPSVSFFDNWSASNKAALDSFTATATFIFPSLGVKYSMIKGFLVNYPPLPTVKKIVQPRKFMIHWESASPSAA